MSQISFIVGGEADTTYYPPRFTDRRDHHERPNHMQLGGTAIFMDDDDLKKLAVAIITYMYDNGINDPATADRLAHLTAVMADDRGYDDAAADAAYDQYVDDAAMGV